MKYNSELKRQNFLIITGAGRALSFWIAYYLIIDNFIPLGVDALLLGEALLICSVPCEALTELESR